MALFTFRCLRVKRLFINGFSRAETFFGDLIKPTANFDIQFGSMVQFSIERQTLRLGRLQNALIASFI